MRARGHIGNVIRALDARAKMPSRKLNVAEIFLHRTFLNMLNNKRTTRTVEHISYSISALVTPLSAKKDINVNGGSSQPAGHVVA